MKLSPLLIVVAYLSSTMQASADVTINSPSNGSTVSSLFQLNATSQGWSRPISMLVYANNTLVFQNQGQSPINTPLTLSAGTYSIVVLAQYSRAQPSSTAIEITVASSATSPSVASQIAADMQGSNEGNPDGVPLSYDWAGGPVLGVGNNFAPQAALEWWGGLFTGPTGNPATNTFS